MTPLALEGRRGAKIDIDLCGDCRGFWFDTHESLRLSPGSTLKLFALMAEPASACRPLPQMMRCPRCSARLALTHNIQRSTRFQYWQCPQRHGHYYDTLSLDRRHFLERYRPVDVAFKVVGTGSVGTRDYVILCFGNGSEDPLFLQMKEEPTSGYAPYLKIQISGNQGQRVAEGQRLMQAQSDIFLGWTRMDGRDYLVRQLADHKATICTDDLKGRCLTEYAKMCGEVLGKGHARSGDGCVLDGYCGDTEKLDSALAEFAIAYADQSTADYELFTSAVKKGRIAIAKGVD